MTRKEWIDLFFLLVAIGILDVFLALILSVAILSAHSLSIVLRLS